MDSKPIPAYSYDFLTPYFDFFSNLFGFGDKQKNKIIDLLKLRKSEKLLDIGCGTGSLLVIAKTRYPYLDMTGVDVDDKALSIAQKKIQKNNLNIKLIKTSADKLPFADNSYDVVVSTLVFHHLPTEAKKRALKQISRVLKKNGRFLLVDFGEFKGFRKILYYLAILLRIPEAGTLKDNVEGKIPEFLKQANFKFKEISPRYKSIQYILAKKIN